MDRHGDKRAEQLAEIQRRREQWMRERQAELDRTAITGSQGDAGYRDYYPDLPVAEARPSTSHPPADGGAHDYGFEGHGRAEGQEEKGGGWGGEDAGRGRSQGGGAGVGQSVLIRPEEVMDKITERITHRLRDELRLELRKETAEAMKDQAAQGRKLEGFLASEIESHTCPICYELMLPPEHSPMLLFPCGHTFCSQCLRSHEAAHGTSKCPYCRQKIGSKAVNMSLQQIVQSYSTKRDKIQAGEPFEDPVAGRGAGAGAGGGGGGGGVNAPLAEDQIRRDFHTKHTRVRILRNELVDTQEEKAALGEKLRTAATVLEHLHREEGEVQTRFRAVQAELDVLQEQMREQERKQVAVQREMHEADAKDDLIRRTLEPLEREVDKLELLMRGVGGGSGY